MKARLLLLQAQTERFWAARNARERIILISGGTALLIVIYVMSLIGLQHRIAALQHKLPELLLNSYEIAAGARTEAPRTTHAGDLRSDLFKILADRGLKAELRALSSNQVEVRLPDQDAKVLFNTLNTLRQAAGARVQSLQIRADQSASATGATAVLERAP